MKSSVNFSRLSSNGAHERFRGRSRIVSPRFLISTSSESIKNSFGIRTAWLLPLQNTLVDFVTGVHVYTLGYTLVPVKRLFQGAVDRFDLSLPFVYK